MKTITVNVTQNDIDTGRRSSPMGCPLALALKRVTPRGYQWVTVGSFDACFYSQNPRDTIWEGTTMTIALPPAAELFIAHFDNGRKTTLPFTFDIETK